MRQRRAECETRTIGTTTVRIFRSRRKTIAIELNRQGEVTVRVPVSMSDRQVEAFVLERQDWICRNRKRLQEAGPAPKPLEPEEIEHLKKEARPVLEKRVRYYAEKMGVQYGRIAIRHQKTRWGSCSADGNLNFNCMLMKVPPFVLDYVVVHELCHRKQMNHSPAFWTEVEKILPDYRKARQWLKNCHLV